MSQFEEYASRYGGGFIMERGERYLAHRQHTDGEEALYSPGEHSTWGWAHLFQDIGNDPENEVIIITATGHNWMRAGKSPHFGIGDAPEDKKRTPDPSRLRSRMSFTVFTKATSE